MIRFKSEQRFVTVGVNRDYASVSDAIREGNSNIIIDAGIYYDSWVTYRPYLTLICLDGIAVFDGIKRNIDTNKAFTAYQIALGEEAHGCWLENIAVINSPGFGFWAVGKSQGNNIFVNCYAENCFMSGFYIASKNNLFYKCRSDYNYQFLQVNGSGEGEHSDGFSVSHALFPENNQFYYCSATGNSDDGFDTFRGKRTLFYGCISKSNGYDKGNINRNKIKPSRFSGNGVGFKLGGDLGSYFTSAKYCEANNNAYIGITNNGANDCEIYNCTASGNIKYQILPTRDRTVTIINDDTIPSLTLERILNERPSIIKN